MTSPRVHLIANLFDESPDGDWRRISQCTINPELRNGLAQRELVVPGERYDMQPPCFAMAHHLRAGHRLVLRVTTSDPDKVPMFAEDVQVTVFTGPGATSVDVPVVPGATLYPDTVPLTQEEVVAPGPAQAPVDGSVTTLAPGAGQRVDGVTSQFVEFTVPDGVDNAKAVVQATPSLPADLDLYLQRRAADGSWGGDIASGASGRADRGDDDHDPASPRHLPDRGAQLGGPARQQRGGEGDLLQLGGSRGQLALSPTPHLARVEPRS